MVIYIQGNVTQPLKKNEILPIAITWMNLEGMMLSKISQTKKNKYCVLSLTYGI